MQNVPANKFKGVSIFGLRARQEIKRKPLMEEVVLDYPRLKARIKTVEDRDKVIKILYEIADDYRHSVMNGFKKSLDYVLGKLYDGIHFNVPPDIDFYQLCHENNVVLVPNHQSHADYLAINYMVFKLFNFPLYIAGGNNLNFFPLGKLFRGSGCFFIRRSFQNDILYKLTLEAYLYWLLGEGKTIEFFFEGGRSRTGKLRSPKFGLYQMLLETHSQLPPSKKKKLLFLPVSINHEYVPEQKSMAKELLGGKKKKESTLQLLNLFKLISYQFGHVHIHVGHPIEGPNVKELPTDQLKKSTQDLAFNCFRAVGKKMVVTPTSLLSLILLEEPSGAMKWPDIINKAKVILDYCGKFKIPLTDSLKQENFESGLERAIDILIGNSKVEIIGDTQVGHIFYSIRPSARMELLYFKNTILHHFLLPWTITSAWIKIFNGTIQNVDEFKEYFINSRNQLKYEFYLPKVMQFFHQAFKIVSHCIGKPITSFEQLLELNRKEFYNIFSKVGVFSKAGSYIYEGYYLSALGIKSLTVNGSFTYEEFFKEVRRIFEREKKLGRVIKYDESFSDVTLRNSLSFFENEEFIKFEKNGYVLIKEEEFNKLIDNFEIMLLEKLTINIIPQAD